MIPRRLFFLGVIVSYSRGSGPGRPPTWMIVDGQQRVTTLYLSIMAAVYTAAVKGDFDWATDIIGRYLLVRKMSGLLHNTKLIPSYNDRQQFHNIWDKISKVKNLASHAIYASNPPQPPAPSGASEGAMLKQFNNIYKDFSKLYDALGLDGLNERVEILANRLSVVSISLREPTVAPKIFERLNHGAAPITVADLVRNEIFSRSGNDINSAQGIFQSRWEPFVGRFKEKNQDLNKFLFPYGLTKNPNVKRNDLFTTLRLFWDQSGSPSEIIDDLERCQRPYIALEYGVKLDGIGETLHARIDRLHRINCPSSIYSFLLSLLTSCLDGEVSEEVAVKVFDSIESFIFRRAICGIEPSGLHAVFKGLWRDIAEKKGTNLSLDLALDADNLKEIIKSRATVIWPGNVEFKEAIISGPLYRRKVANYALREYELSLTAECPSDIFEIEHIAPQKRAANWDICTPEEYEKTIHTWGNLTPISGEMNPAASAKSFDDKKRYYTSSKYFSARMLAEKDIWDVKSIRDRSNLISEWAITRWVY